ncbi:MAG: MBG domain-containing protein [Vicinamibacteria bacterium]
MVWLQGYVRDAVLRPWITAQPSAAAATVGDDVAFACAGDGSGPLSYQWRRDGVPIADNATASTPALLIEDVVTADAGAYDCVVSNAAGSAVSASAALTVQKAAAAVTIVGLAQTYDGTPRAVTVTTAPAGLAVVVTYDGSPTAPAAPGTYAVVATVADADYEGSSSATLVISTSVVVRHAPVLNGRVDGSVQVLLPESVTLNGSARVSGDLLVPGTPLVRLNGQPAYGGTIDFAGSAAPASHTVTLNGGAALRHVARRTDAAALSAVPAPAPPSGTRDVVLNAPGQSPGDFATVRNLTLNGGAGTVAVPPGAYGAFVANGGSALVLGVAGAIEPSLYDLRSLTLNGGAALRVAGPVVLTVGSAVTLNGAAGDASNAGWLALRVASGGVTVDGSGALNGRVTAPAGGVVVNGTLRGRVEADRLTVNGNGVLTAQP